MPIKKMLLLVLLLVGADLLFAQQRADALVLYRSGRYPEAITICEQEIKENPHNIDSYCVLCWSLVRNRQYLQAEQYATEARKVNSSDIRLIEVLGEAKYYLGKNSAAMELFQLYIATASATAARIPNAYYYMGEIYIRQAKYQHADIAMTACVQAEPTSDYWWTRCGYAREMATSYQSALDAYNKALNLNAAQTEAARGKERCTAKLR